MSSRTIRKLCGDSQQLPQSDEDESSGDEGPSYSTASTQKVNPFLALLSDSEDNETHDDDVSDDTEDEEVLVAGPSKRKKRNKKKSKKRQNPYAVAPVDKDDDIDSLVEHILGNDAPMPVEAEPEVPEKPAPIMSIKLKNLSPVYEWIRIFGADAVHGGKKAPRKRIHNWVKHTHLLSPKDAWGPLKRVGLSMSVDRVINGLVYFKFDHSSEYQRIQKTLLHYIDTNDHHSIKALHDTFPFHVDSLLQMFFKTLVMDEDYATAHDLLEKAIFYMEYVMPSHFNFAADDCRLEYDQQENRSFHIALLKRIQYLSDKVAHRTALEVAKLCVRLDPTDPLAICLIIDTLALRCQQYEWLVKVIDLWNVERNILGLVNMTFSYALANFHLRKKGLAHREPDQLLEDAILRYPCVFTHLFASLSKAPEIEISEHSLFKESGENSVPRSLWHLSRLYAERGWQLWREADVQEWLVRAARGAMTRYDDHDPFISVATVDNLRLYTKTPVPVLRHLIVLNLSSFPLVASDSPIPMAQIRHIDPIPPMGGANIYVNSASPVLRPHTSALTAFLQSLMPSFNIQSLVEEIFNDQERE